MKKSTTRVTFAVTIMILLVLGYYAYLTNRSRTYGNAEISYVENVLLKDLEHNYPPSPKEVMKYYHEIMKCFYNEECTDEEITELAEKARGLYDDDLVANNEWDSYLENLKSDILTFKSAKRRISSFSVAASTDVEYFTEDGFEFARIRCGYNLKENGVYMPTSQVYLLRKDKDNHWKIYGWDLAQNVNPIQE